MHPDPLQIATYLDDALDEAARAELRAHLLTCSACAARLERLRGDARLAAGAIAAHGEIAKSSSRF